MAKQKLRLVSIFGIDFKHHLPCAVVAVTIRHRNVCGQLKFHRYLSLSPGCSGSFALDYIAELAGCGHAEVAFRLALPARSLHGVAVKRHEPSLWNDCLIDRAFFILKVPADTDLKG